MAGSQVFKWAEISASGSPFRFKILSEYLNSVGVTNHHDTLMVRPADFVSELERAKSNYSAIKIGNPYGIQITKMFNYQNALLINIGAADSLTKTKEGKWELSAFGLDAFRRIIRKHGSPVRLESVALIVGSGSTARFSIFTMVELGFKKIRISNQFHEQAKALIEEFRKKFFQVQFEFVPEDQLVLLAGDNTVLVNTTPFVPENTILKELYYFNFLKPDGIVIDFTFLPLNTQLIREAEHIGIKVVRGYEIFAYSDIFWAKHVFGVDLDINHYCQLLFKEGEKWEKENYSTEEQQQALNKSPKF